MTRSTSAGQGHLLESEFVDLLDGTLPGWRKQHLDECAGCRDEADALAFTLRDATGLDVPEPPPFFWSQFSSRVRDVVAEEPRRGGVLWRAVRPTGARWAAFAAAAALVMAVGLWRAGSDTVRPSSTGTESLGASAAGADAGDDTFVDIDADEDWALVRSIADELPTDAVDAAGVTARPGSADGMALRLSDTERRELARLLEAEIKRGPSPGSSS
jgi:hypothetical protein